MPEKFRVLLVEDTAELREDLALELRDAGYCVLEACNGSTAYAAFLGERPDLVLCDIQLPDIDGISLLTSLRGQERSGKLTPVIVISAFSDAALRRKATDLGVEQYLVKPVDYAQLLETVAEILGTETPVSDS